MEAFCAMINGDLPPAGNRISLRFSAENPLVDIFAGSLYWVDSGTSALALALLDIKSNAPGCVRPQAIIPGYCCPDLISACIFAGVEPVALDISVDDPSFCFDTLSNYLSGNPNVIAVIAINFMGVAERITELQRLIDQTGSQAVLIEDNAQWLPAISTDVPLRSRYTTFSFGRGKPMSLLGGGLLVSQLPLQQQVAAKIGVAPSPDRFKTFLKIVAYNTLLYPHLYFWINRNPLLRLGVTEYVSLSCIGAMDSVRLSLVDANYQCFSGRVNGLVDEYKNNTAHLQRLGAINSPRAKNLLRFPLLCSNEDIKLILLRELRANGLGASAMYPSEIDHISGVGGLVNVPSPLRNAQSFASRFMTLPLHSGVRESHRKRLVEIFKRY